MLFLGTAPNCPRILSESSCPICSSPCFCMKSSKKPLDPVVKVGLTVFVGSFFLIGIGMFLSRPDRSIPPYSIGSQEGTVVAIHLPPWTSDPEIRRLIQRFQKVSRETGDFAAMKIRPTTPDDPQGRYQRMTIYFFSDHTWTEREVLHRYLNDFDGSEENRTFRKEFESAVRGGYEFDHETREGWIGPIRGHQVPVSNGDGF